jgi:GAF domain-containing protein
VLIEEDLMGWLQEHDIPIIGEVAQSWLGVPLMIGDEVQGVMVVQNYTTPRAFTENDRDRLVAIAGQVAVAIQNARLFGEIQTRAHHEQILREITSRVRGTTDPDIIVRTAVQELGTALGRRTFIRLGSTEDLSGMNRSEGGE